MTTATELYQCFNAGVSLATPPGWLLALGAKVHVLARRHSSVPHLFHALRFGTKTMSVIIVFLFFFSSFFLFLFSSIVWYLLVIGWANMHNHWSIRSGCSIRSNKLCFFFFFQNKFCFSFEAKKFHVTATVYQFYRTGDLPCMNATDKCLWEIDIVHHAVLRFMTNCRAITHHCNLYSQVGWPPLSTRKNVSLVHFYLGHSRSIAQLSSK